MDSQACILPFLPCPCLWTSSHSPVSLSYPPILPILYIPLLTKHFHLQIMEDYAKGGCKNGYLRHMDSSILGHDGVPTPGIPRDQSLEDELLHVLDTFFQKKATVSLESR